MKILKKFFTKVILVLAGICLAILLAEVFVRIFYPESRGHVVPSGFFERDSYLGWGLENEESVTHDSKYFNVNYTTNSFGFRDEQRFIQKEDNKFRILLYGDSQIFGWGVPVEKRFSNLLEKSLPHMEIWNLAVPAYGLDQQVLSYKRDGVNFNADAVIFYLSEYTLERINYGYLYHKNKPRFIKEDSNNLKIIPPQKSRFIRDLIDLSLSWMYLPFFIEERVSFFNSKPDLPDQSDKIAPKIRESLSELEKRILLYAKDLTGSGNKLMIILFSSYTIKGKGIKDFCSLNGFPYYDTRLNDNEDSLILGSGDGHWNSKANQIIFRQLFPEIKKLTSIKRSNFLTQRIFYNNTIR